MCETADWGGVILGERTGKTSSRGQSVSHLSSSLWQDTLQGPMRAEKNRERSIDMLLYEHQKHSIQLYFNLEQTIQHSFSVLYDARKCNKLVMTKNNHDYTAWSDVGSRVSWWCSLKDIRQSGSELKYPDYVAHKCFPVGLKDVIDLCCSHGKCFSYKSWTLNCTHAT